MIGSTTVRYREVTMSKGHSLQDPFLNILRKERVLSQRDQTSGSN